MKRMPKTLPGGVAILAALMVLAGPSGAPVFAMGEVAPAASGDAGVSESAGAGEAAGQDEAAAGQDEAAAGQDGVIESGEGLENEEVCPEGFIFNDETKECDEREGAKLHHRPASGWAGADPDFVAAAVLVHAGAYERAIAAFEALGRPDDPYVLNYLGYASRKLGRIETALRYYHRALALRPDYARARSYLGEGLVAMGRIDEARVQLAMIEDACGARLRGIPCARRRDRGLGGAVGCRTHWRVKTAAHCRHTAFAARAPLSL